MVGTALSTDTIFASRPLIFIADSPSIHTYFDVIPESPDGKHVTWFQFVGPPLTQGKVMIGNLDGKSPVVVAEISGNAHCGAKQGWLDNEHIYYSANGKVYIADLSGEIVHSFEGTVATLHQGNREGLTCSSNIKKFGGKCDKESACYSVNIDTQELTELLDKDQAWQILTASGTAFADLDVDVKEQMDFKNIKWAPDGEKWLVVFTNEHYCKGTDLKKIKVLLISDRKGNHIQLLDSFTHHPNWFKDSSGVFAFKGLCNIEQWKLEGEIKSSLLIKTPFEGHPDVSSDMRYLSTDGYCFDEPRHASAVVFDMETGNKEFVLECSYPHVDWQTKHPPHVLCHLHPVWSYDGTRLYLNVVHDGMPRFCYLDFSNIEVL